MQEIILNNNQSLMEISEHDIIITFTNEKRLLEFDEIEEIKEQIREEIYFGSTRPGVTWNATIII